MNYCIGWIGAEVGQNQMRAGPDAVQLIPEHVPGNAIFILVASLITLEELRVAFVRREPSRACDRGVRFVLSGHAILRTDSLFCFLSLIALLLASAGLGAGWRTALTTALSVLLLFLAVSNRLFAVRLQENCVVVERGLLPDRWVTYSELDRIVYRHRNSNDSGLWLYDRDEVPVLGLGDFADGALLIQSLFRRGIALDSANVELDGRKVQQLKKFLYLTMRVTLIWALAFMAMGRSIWPGVIPTALEP